MSAPSSGIVLVSRKRVRARDHLYVAVDVAHPRDHVAVVEAHDQAHRHRHRAAEALDDADDVDGVVADRHAVDDPHAALGRVELGLEHERAVE